MGAPTRVGALAALLCVVLLAVASPGGLGQELGKDQVLLVPMRGAGTEGGFYDPHLRGKFTTLNTDEYKSDDETMAAILAAPQKVVWVENNFGLLEKLLLNRMIKGAEGDGRCILAITGKTYSSLSKGAAGSQPLFATRKKGLGLSVKQAKLLDGIMPLTNVTNNQLRAHGIKSFFTRAWVPQKMLNTVDLPEVPDPKAGEEAYIITGVGSRSALEKRDFRSVLQAVKYLNEQGVPVKIKVGTKSRVWKKKIEKLSLPAECKIEYGCETVILSPETYRGVVDGAQFIVIPILTSSQVGRGLTTQVEALWRGKSVVTTNVPDWEGYLEDGVNSMLVEPMSNVSYARAIQALWGEGGAEVRARAAQRSERARFTSENGVRVIEEACAGKF